MKKLLTVLTISMAFSSVSHAGKARLFEDIAKPVGEMMKKWTPFEEKTVAKKTAQTKVAPTQERTLGGFKQTFRLDIDEVIYDYNQAYRTSNRAVNNHFSGKTRDMKFTSEPTEFAKTTLTDGSSAHFYVVTSGDAFGKRLSKIQILTTSKNESILKDISTEFRASKYMAKHHPGQMGYPNLKPVNMFRDSADSDFKILEVPIELQISVEEMALTQLIIKLNRGYLGTSRVQAVASERQLKIKPRAAEAKREAMGSR